MEVFTIYNDEIRDRIDVQFYLNSVKTASDITDFKYDHVPFGELGIEIRKGIFNLLSCDYKAEGIPFIRISNIGDEEMIWNDAVFISEESNQKEKRTQLHAGDIVFSKIGTIDRVGFLDDKFPVYNMSQNIIGAKLSTLNTKIILPNYLHTFFKLDIGINQLIREATHQVQPKLTLDAIRNIIIPIPPIDIQMRIVEIMDLAFSVKKQKLDKAESLHNSINDYILEELGIKIPEYSNQKIFTVFSDELVNERIDPYYFQPIFYSIIKSIKQSRYPLKKLEELIEKLINGFDFRDFQVSGIPYLKVANIKPYRFDFTKESFIDLDVNSISKNLALRKGNLLLTRKGTYGVAVSIKEDLNYIICSEIFKLVLKKEVKSDYLEIVLNSSIGRIQFDRNKIGAIMGSLSQEAVGLTYIPLPPLTVQAKIIEEVKIRIEKAESLKLEAVQVLENAKNEVNKILLGK